MGPTKWHARTIPDLIIEVWEALDCESVGARELEQIQQALRERFGEGARESPAAIARTVADEGAVLRHSEVFEFDLKWRRQNLDERSFPERLDFSNLSAAFDSIVKVEEKRLKLQTETHRGTGESEKGETENNQTTLEWRQLRAIVTASRDDSLLRSRSKILELSEREEAKEIAHWLTVWLQAPELFSDWLDLRRRAPEFRKKFKS